MSFVITVSQQLIDKCEVERNPISLAAVKRWAMHNCCMQMCYSMVLITKGRVRIFVRLVEESNRAEAWRLRNNRYVPDTQNRQCATMQKIMMFAKLWCDHVEGFESGSGAWELDVGEWERASGIALADAVKHIVMMNMAPSFWEQFAVGFVRQQCRCSSNSFVAMVFFFCRNFGANPTVSWKWNRCG